MERVGTFLPTLDELAGFFSVDRKTVRRALARDPALADALARGKGKKTQRLSRAQQLLAEGYWRCMICRRVLEANEDEPGGRCSSDHKKPLREFVPPNPIMLIWLGKQHMGQSDKSLLETKYGGDPKKIPDEDLVKLLPDALRSLGVAVGEQADELVAKIEDEDAEKD